MTGQTIATTAIICFSSGTGGMERSAVRLAGFLSAITRVVLICKKGAFVERLYHQQARRFPCESIHFHSRTFSFSMLGGTRRLVEKHAIDNVIFFGASELKTLYFAFRRFDLNLIVWHGTTKSHPKRDFLHNRIYSGVNYHVALSRHLIENVKTIVPLTKGVEYRVIRPSFDFPVNDERKPSSETLSILHVGRIADGKGQLDAVLACRLLRQAQVDFRLDLVGTPEGDDYIEKVEAAIEQSPVGDRIRLTGYVDSVNDYLEKADILLFPSRGEGMPNAFIEALHYNIVCIAYDNTVFPEFLTMGFHVRLVEDGNVDALSACLLDVVEHLSAEKQAASKNAALARQAFSVDRELAEWRQILRG